MKGYLLFLLLLLVHTGSHCDAAEDEIKPVIRGQSVSLTCPVDVLNCGELHSIKWFKGSTRIAVLSGDGKVSNVEGGTPERLSIDHAPNRSGSRLHIKSVMVDDEDNYLCEITYLEPLETCETTGTHSIDMKVIVPPSAILVMDNKDNVIRNGTTLGPMREGQKLELTCEVRGARPMPNLSWYRSGKKLPDVKTLDERNGLFTVQSKLALTLSRQELSAVIECRVETSGLEQIVTNQLYVDMQVRPTKIQLTGVKLHVIEGAKVLLQCQVYGARPAANVSWYNSSKEIDEDNDLSTISTKTYLQSDGTFETVSQMIFTATRFENGVLMRCEADNVVMRDDLDKPIHETLLLEVMYPPVVTVKPDNITMNETDDFLLFCEYEANPASLEQVRWLRNSHVLNVNQSRFEGGNSEQTALLVKNATRDDTGSYTCELTNNIGSGVSENFINVNIQFTPIVSLRIEPESPIVEDDNTNVTLHCDVLSGNPSTLLKVRWYLDTHILKELPECSDESLEKNEDNLCFIDPTVMLLQNVGREFLGNYSCKGFNAAGWGEESEFVFLDVFYEPGNASISFSPAIPMKHKSMTLNCYVEDMGNPTATRYRWLRGDKPVIDVVTSVWTIDPVGLDSRNNFSCYAYNEGGNGGISTVEIDTHVAPAFIQKLQPYTGALFSTPGISLSCRVECYPSCIIFWFKDGQEITEENDKYFMRESMLPVEPSTGDFESVHSVLHFNLTAWTNEKLDIIKDSANYSCASSNNSAGPGVRSTTYFGVEYPPENMTVSHPEVFVEEGSMPARVLCQAKSSPEATYYWKRFDGEIVSKNNALMITKAQHRSDAGIYTCWAINKHGNTSYEVQLTVTYAPNCTITRGDIDGQENLICIADGNPKEYDFEWDFKSENETGEEKLKWTDRGERSYLILSDDFHHKRYYRCTVNNSAGVGTYCEIQVAGHLLWWQSIERMTLYIAIAVVLISLISVIIVCIVIIYICRNRRKRSSKSMEKSLMENKPVDLLGDTGENYENLPFHGLQNPPNKFNYLTAPANNINVNVVKQLNKFSHPPSNYPDYFDSSARSMSIGATTPNSTLRSVHSYTNTRPYPTPMSAAMVQGPAPTIHSFSLKHGHQSRPHSQMSSNCSMSGSDKANSLSLCINKINLLKKNSSSKPPHQSNTMRCRKHRHRSHHFNIESYQRYQLTKSFSNDTMSESSGKSSTRTMPNAQPTTYKFI